MQPLQSLAAPGLTMKRLWAHITKRRMTEPETPAAVTPPRPDDPFIAIGDLHGQVELLLEIDRLIEAQYPAWPVVFLGDYVDRGERSREVLELLMSVSPKDTPPVTCLMGNHERMLLDFLDDPQAHARRWLGNGGLQTLASFGVALAGRRLDDGATLQDLRDRLTAAMGTEMIDWLRARPLSWRSGNVWAVHAGADPETPMDQQSADCLLWGHPAFLRAPRRDGAWVVHGHTVVEAPQMKDGRIGVDTGAYATGRLSAAAISSGKVAFLQTGSGKRPDNISPDR